VLADGDEEMEGVTEEDRYDQADGKQPWEERRYPDDVDPPPRDPENRQGLDRSPFEDERNAWGS